ncbi:S49 family peptidase [Xanthocytophaga agilis]|uniref:S49 family peptidase n=1 Tax=Xanthocytophaga agilis TaxID=3048010 RepID=A0AAE3QYJ9_9BACT|nr:S49 family peptidase [Xanthocytophaga agilis]MDJ1500471.1 S49 family peptidase [Xanthocytophaga agilis]
MKNYKLLSAILAGHWLIDPTWANANLPLVEAILKGESVDRPAKEYETDAERPYMVYSVQAGTVGASRWTSFNEAPENSIAVIPVMGPMLKYGDGCGGLGTVHYTSYMKEAKSSNKIVGAVLVMDTPGGQVDGTSTFADSIADMVSNGKPVVAFVDDGMLASAGVWAASRASEIIASQPTDTIGSIGVYTTIADYSKWYEQKGIKLTEVYADQSKDKNKDYRDALKGDVSGIKETVNFIADQFIAGVKQFRGDKINTKVDNPFTGKMYEAELALQVGLIDGIGNMEYAVNRVYELQSQATSSTKSNTKSMNLTKKWNAVVTAIGWTALVIGESDQVNEANLQAFGDETKKLQDANAQLTSQIKDLNDKVTAADKGKADAEAALAGKVTELETANAEVTRLKALVPGAQPSATIKTGDDKIPSASSDKNEVIDAEADHNKFAYEMLGR